MKKILVAFSLALLSVTAPTTEPLPPDAAYDIGFSPKRGALDVILAGIESAQVSILVAAYSFTSKPISEALRNAHKRGVDVKVVADAKGNSDKYTAVTFLANQGIAVRLNGKHAILHHKFMVIDGLHVQTGSFNFSAAAANRNAENVLLLWHVKPLADQYAAEWQRLWDEGIHLKPAY
jgi:phosphatidylserine/phosphatidylglycerophosphate/cardiolipin synthase-like enzyme